LYGGIAPTDWKALVSSQGYLIFPQRLEQETSGLKGRSIQVSHVLFDIGNLTKIEESQHKGVKNREDMRSGPLANLASIFGQGSIATIMQTILVARQEGSLPPARLQNRT
jgi:hypothetical protein